MLRNILVLELTFRSVRRSISGVTVGVSRGESLTARRHVESAALWQKDAEDRPVEANPPPKAAESLPRIALC